MQTLNTVRHQDKLVLQSDIDKAVRPTGSLSDATEDTLGRSYFLTSDCIVKLIVNGVQVGTEALRKGRIYTCVPYYYTDPTTGVKVLAYKWSSMDTVEHGKLPAFKGVAITRMVHDGTHVTVRLNWDEGDDVADDSDLRNNAVWKYTAVVRKKGSVPPVSLMDGEIVGYSSVRGQYKQGTGFVDVFRSADENLYSYSVIAVTRGNVETNSNDSTSTTNWTDIKNIIKSGKASTLFAIGDTVTVNNKFFGDVELQVVAFDNANVDGAAHTVTFMCRNIHMRAAYDVKERHVSELDGRLNPGDSVTDSTKMCSVRGRANWESSNLRQWLNAGWNYVKSSDKFYDTTKYYFVVDPTTGRMELVNAPVDPDKVNPRALGYYELVSDMVPRHDWDMLPSIANGDACYSYGDRIVPSFLAGFDEDFVNVLCTVNVFTIQDKITTGSSKYRVQVSRDRVFIPSYREIFGSNPIGLKSVQIREGEQFTYFDKDIEIPGLEDMRSVLKYDSAGVPSGYYLRTMETEKDPMSGGWHVKSASGLWCVSSDGHSTKPSIDTPDTEVTSTFGAHMAASDVKYSTTPGIVWCVVIGG